MIRGISGGQRKRVTTGEMTVGPMKTLFMVRHHAASCHSEHDLPGWICGCIWSTVRCYWACMDGKKCFAAIHGKALQAPTVAAQ